MAVYKADILDIELNTGNIARSFLCHNIGKDDTKADRFGVRVYRDGEPESLSGCSIQGYMMRPNGTNLAITGSDTGVSGNEAWVDLPQAAYDYEGQFCLALKLIGGGVTGTVRIIDGMINNTFVSDAVAPTAAVPTYQEILSVYDQMVAAKAGSVRFDTDQTLTAAQMTQARDNIEAASESDVSDLKSAIDYKDTTYVGGYELGKISQTTGNNNQSTTRVRTNSFLDNTVDVTIEISSTIVMQIFEYTSAGVFNDYYVNVTSSSTGISHNAITVNNGNIKISKSSSYKYKLDFYYSPETTISNAESFIAENVEIINDVVNILDKIGAIENEIYYNEYTAQTGWSEKGYLKTDGTYNTTNTDYQWIKTSVTQGDIVKFSSKNQGNVASLIYLNSGSVVSYEYYNTNVYYDGVEKTIPSGVNEVVINTYIDENHPGKLEIAENRELARKGVETLFERVDEVDNAIYYNKYTVQTGWSEKGFLKTDGTYNTTNASYHWIKKSVTEGDIIKFSSKNQGTIASLIYLNDDTVVSYEYYNTNVYYDGVVKTIPNGVDEVVINTYIDNSYPGKLEISSEQETVNRGVEKLNDSTEKLSDRVEAIEDNEESFSGIKLNCLGDSFTASQTSWHTYVGALLGCTMVNCGVAGSQMVCDDNVAASFYSRLSSLDTSADGTIVFGGINDAERGIAAGVITMGNINSTHDGTTFYGGVMRLFDAIESSSYMQGKLIIGVIPPDFFTGTSSGAVANQTALKEIQAALREIYSAYSIPFVDLKKDCQEMFLLYPNNSVCEYNMDTYRKGSTNKHPSEAGYKGIAKCIVERGIKMVFPRIQ